MTPKRPTLPPIGGNAGRFGGGRLAVFGYGSLVSRASVAETLEREAPAPIPARLAGWRRRWSIYRHNLATEKVFERDDGKPFEHVVGLNLERAPEATASEWPNGALIELTRAELERLDLRELRYDRVEATECVRGAGDSAADGSHAFDHVFVYTAKACHFAAETPPNSIIIASYVRACRSAFNDLEPGAWDLFAATTGEFPAPVVDARLVRDAIPEGNPRAW
ncbi:MAG: gamma-glutamylcyclotransferase family protein [Solirubrobacterales bacterium]